MTVEAYQALERASHDTKYEYVDGQIRAMSGGSRAHSRIGSNVVRLLEDALDDTACHVYNSDARVRLSATRYVYPDASVSCDPGDDETLEGMDVQSPRLIVEVLSASTEAYDRGRKFALYQASSTLEEYVLVATDFQRVEVFRRTTRGWTDYRAYRPDEELDLMGGQIGFPVAALYRRTTISALPEGAV